MGTNDRSIARQRMRPLRRRASWRALALICVCLGAAPGCATRMGEEDRERLELGVAVRDVGIDHLAQGRTAMAIRKLQEAQAKNPDDPVTYLWLGEAFRRKGMLEKAEDHLLRSLELNPDTSDYNHQETVLNLCALHIQLQRYDDARSYCQRLVDDPTFSSPWRALTNRGWAEYKLGRLSEARRSFEEALEFHPRYSPAHLNLGIVEQKERRLLPALRHFELALDSQRLSGEGEAEANYRMAEIYVSLGRRAEAVKHFSLALERSPYGEWGTQSKSYLELLR